MTIKTKLNQWWCGFTTDHYPREKRTVYTSEMLDADVVGWSCVNCGMLTSDVDELEHIPNSMQQKIRKIDDELLNK